MSPSITVHPAWPAAGEGRPPTTAGAPEERPDQADGAVSWRSGAGRAIVLLLRLTGHWSRPGWRALLLPTALFIAITAGAALSTYEQFTRGLRLLAAGTPLFPAMTQSAFLGVPVVLRWLALAATFAFGRRRYAELMSEVARLMDDMAELPGFAKEVKALRRRVVVVLMLFVGATAMTFYAMVWGYAMEQCKMFGVECIGHLVLVLGISLFAWCSLLIPLRFLFLSELLIGGFRTISVDLRSLPDLPSDRGLRSLPDLPTDRGDRLPTKRTLERRAAAGLGAKLHAEEQYELPTEGGSEHVSAPGPAGSVPHQLLMTRLARLRGLYVHLSCCSDRLCLGMSSELVSSMLCGTITLVLTLFLMLPSSSQFDSVSATLMYAAMSCIELNMPCEAGQRLLDAALDVRDALLKTPWISANHDLPHELGLRQEVSLFVQTVTRDADQLGDLGYLRLQRATLVSTLSTVLTYVIVCLQFVA